ncbi:MAG TPA: hypothetical protein VI357_06005 [Mycobacteriales bacterium]
MAEETSGVVIPAGTDGRRSTTALGRAVVAGALRPVDPAGADAAGAEPAWRTNYPAHFRRLVEAGLPSAADWLRIAGSGLDAAYGQLRVVLPGGAEAPLSAALTAPAGRELRTDEVRGTGEPERELVLPWRGERLRGDGIRRQVEAWIAAGVAEPSLAGPVEAVLAHPEWLRLEGTTVAALGAAAEMAPLAPLLRWGATVAAVDLSRPALWERLRRTARDGAGRLLIPVAGGPDRPAQCGADLLTEVPAVADWLAGLPGRLLLGNYAYADGSLHLRVSAAADVLARRLQRDRDDVALAFLATPTDVFAVPPEAVAAATAGYERRSRIRTAPLRTVSRGRLYQPPYGTGPGVNDSLIPQQGPNYALAKRLQRWRAAVARDAGTTVSFHVAPSTRTRSVVSNRALRAAFDGAHHYGVEVFEPDTASTLLAALLVHDLNTAPVTAGHPWQDEARTAVHGGLWRTPYAPRSVLPIAAVRGLVHV